MSDRAKAVVAALDALDPDRDPEKAHAEADALLLSPLTPTVRDAYERVRERARWWACS